MEKKQLIPAKDVVDLFPVSVCHASVLRWIRIGHGGVKLPAKRVCGRWYVDPDDVPAFLKKVSGNGQSTS